MDGVLRSRCEIEGGGSEVDGASLVEAEGRTGMVGEHGEGGTLGFRDSPPSHRNGRVIFHLPHANADSDRACETLGERHLKGDLCIRAAHLKAAAGRIDRADRQAQRLSAIGDGPEPVTSVTKLDARGVGNHIAGVLADEADEYAADVDSAAVVSNFDDEGSGQAGAVVRRDAQDGNGAGLADTDALPLYADVADAQLAGVGGIHAERHCPVPEPAGDAGEMHPTRAGYCFPGAVRGCGDVDGPSPAFSRKRRGGELKGSAGRIVTDCHADAIGGGRSHL